MNSNKLIPVFFLELSIISIILLMLFFLGQSFDSSWQLFSTGLGFYFSWYIYHLFQLLKYWSSKQLLPNIPVFGVWHEIWIHVSQLQQKERHKQTKVITNLDNYHIFINKIPDAAIIINENSARQKNSIEWFNKSAQLNFNLKKKKHIGSSINKLFTDTALDNFLSTKKNKKQLEIRSPIDCNRVFSLQIIPYQKSSRILLFRDISRTYWVDKMRKNFIANVSHELRTPLTVIGGYLETFESHFKKDKTYLPAIQSMKQQSLRMNNLIQDLLVLSKLESDTGKLKKKHLIPVAVIIKNIIKDIRVINGKHHRIESDIDDSLMISGYENEIQSMVSNLINNAVRYTPTGSLIKVSWYRDHKKILFSVEDNGEGIEKQHLQHLTERFYRVDRGRSRSDGATGLGLSIVKHILNHHDAKLKIKSQLGKGSQFICYFNG